MRLETSSASGWKNFLQFSTKQKQRVSQIVMSERIALARFLCEPHHDFQSGCTQILALLRRDFDARLLWHRVAAGERENQRR